MQRWMSQVRKGVIELWLMAILARGEAYGYEVFQQLSGKVGEGIGESTVYPILARLTREGWAEVRKGSSPAGPQRRYFRLTPQGEARLKRMKQFWKELQRESDEILREAR
ncbi:MAG: PadR family transcriptional regulator [Candidatus Brocadiia bacterium]